MIRSLKYALNSSSSKEYCIYVLQGHNRKLREMMIPKKHRRVYKKIKFGEKRRARELKKLQSKRAKLDVGDSSAQ